MNDDQSELIKEFIVECSDQMDGVDNDLLTLEQDPTNKDLLSKVFRAFHNMKGSSGFLGFHKLESLTHVGENLLSKMRDGVILLNPQITGALMAMGDAVREIFDTIENTGADGDKDYLELKDRLNQLIESGGKVAEAKKEAPKPVAKELDPIDLEIEEALAMAKQRREKAKSEESLKKQENEESKEAPTVEKAADKKVEPVKSSEAANKSAASAGGVVIDSSIRVELSILDKLMNLVGELVLTRNQVLQTYVPGENSYLTKSIQVLNRITSELQEEVMKTRMQPINNIFSKFPRIVRGLADSVGKKIELEIEGKETELDRTLLDSLRDPLTHMIRNSVDHGIEIPEKRVSSGKSEKGTLLLKAYHEGGQVHIDIIDDGGGINPEIIKKKAIEKNVITNEQAEAMSDKEIVNLVFAAGFSTAEKVTNISGRGVGMDVVKTNIEKIGGTVEVNSKVGEGTTFNLKVPLTLAIMPALIIGVGDDRLAIPQVNIREMQRLDKEQYGLIEEIHSTPVLNLRKELVPLLDLNDQLGLGKLNYQEKESINVVVIQVDDRLIGVIVEAVYDSQEIVVKPMGSQLEGIAVYAGATILGDGKIALILDVVGLAERAHAFNKNKATAKKKKEEVMEVNVDLEKILLCKNDDGGRTTITMSDVQRLESFHVDEFEEVGGKEVIKYRNSILPIYRSANILPERRKKIRQEGAVEVQDDLTDHDHVQAIIVEVCGKEAGVIVGKVMDSLEMNLKQMGPSTRPGVRGTLVIQDKVAELIDVEAMIKMADPHFFEASVKE